MAAATDVRVHVYVHDELPSRGWTEQFKVAHHPCHKSLVLRSVVLGVQDEDNASYIGAIYGHAECGLEADLHGPAPSLKQLRRSVADVLLPCWDAGLEDSSGEAAARLEGEFPRVQAEEG